MEAHIKKSLLIDFVKSRVLMKFRNFPKIKLVLLKIIFTFAYEKSIEHL